ncbi:MAG: hypothetical protein JSS54_05355 [Proteobacteria bacterium]|nr:hypothetical protein [Pseudomonadota bacterium]
MQNLLVPVSSRAISRCLRFTRSGVFLAAGVAAFVLSSAYAYAVDNNVRQACRGDYYQHCSQFSVGTEELRKCMRSVGEGLSAPCLVALVQAGEITQADVERHNAAKAGKNATKTVAAGGNDTKATVDPKDVSSKSIKSRKAAKASAVGDAGKSGKLPKKIAASSKAKPGNKTKAKTTAAAAPAAGNAGKSVSAVSGNKNKKNTKSKKTAKKMSSSKPSAGKAGATKPASANTIASKKVKKVPVNQTP